MQAIYVRVCIVLVTKIRRLIQCSSARRNQEISPLLRLPAELRNRIYKFALSDRSLYFWGKRLHCVYFRHSNREYPIWDEVPDINFFALIRACSQTYSEAARFCFSLNRFIGGAKSLTHCLGLLSNSTARCIETIVVDSSGIRAQPFLSDLCKLLNTLHRFEGLKLLVVHWQYHQAYEWKSQAWFVNNLSHLFESIRPGHHVRIETEDLWSEV
jgi:hypothetical protein